MNQPASRPTPATLSLESALRERRSVRGYLPDPVPDTVLREVFELAQTAPSNCNVQPWQVYVASGATRDELRRRFTEGVASGKAMTPALGFLPALAGAPRARPVECAQALYGAMGIARDDKAGRMRATLRNFELFDAPHVCFIGMDRAFGELMALDVGMYTQTLMLVMAAHGIGSCAQGSMGYYPQDVREVFGIDDNIAILFGISFGYEDTTVAANQARTVRAPLGESVVFR